TNACENAPSAKRRRRMFGRRNAASNASIWSPAPKEAALRLSRASPVIRDRSVMALTVETARSRFTRATPMRIPFPAAGAGRHGDRGSVRSGRKAFGGDAAATGRAGCASCRKVLLCLVFFVSSRFRRKSTDGEQRPGPQARPTGDGEEQAQRESPLLAAHGGQAGKESDRCRRQGRGGRCTQG